MIMIVSMTILIDDDYTNDDVLIKADNAPT